MAFNENIDWNKSQMMTNKVTGEVVWSTGSHYHINFEAVSFKDSSDLSKGILVSEFHMKESYIPCDKNYLLTLKN